LGGDKGTKLRIRLTRNGIIFSKGFLHGKRGIWGGAGASFATPPQSPLRRQDPHLLRQ
jgi:hypothetical protein